MTSDVIVVGGGVIGLASALELARRGASVAVLADGRPGASAAAAGMLCPSFEALHLGGPALRALGEESLALWDGLAASLCADPARDLDYRRDGVLAVGFPPGLLRGEAAVVPGGVDAAAALRVPGEGQVDPRRLLRALGRACDEAGVRRKEGRVVGVGDDRSVRLADAGALTAGAVVLASGADALGEAELVPLRGRAFSVAEVPDAPAEIVRSPTVYLCPKADGTLYVGATEEERDMPSAPDALWHEACWLLPSLRAGRVVARRDGVRPGTRDGLPIVGRSARSQGVVLALGHHRNGVLLAPLTARRVAALALSGG